VGWTAADDQWCANHNSQTNPSVMASPAPLGATVPTESCSISYYPGDTSCAQVTAGFDRCQYHNSQVESYCEAYEAAKMAGTGEKTVLLLDIAATAVCGTACATGFTGVGQAAYTACSASSTAASAAEILVTLTQKSSAVGKIVDLALSGVGVAEGVNGLMKGNGLISATDGKGYADNESDKGGVTKQQKKNACITAAALAALSGVRYYNNGYGERSKQSSCKNIWSLQSSASAIAGGVTAAGYTSSGGSTSTSGSSTGSSTGSSSGTNAATGQSCTSSNLSAASCGQVSAATDGGLLTNSGLGNAVSPVAQQLAGSGALQAAKSGGIGSAMGGAMGGDGNVGTALAKVAQTAADNAKELGQVAQMSSGGGSGRGTASDTSGLSNLFGNTSNGPAVAPMAIFKGDGDDETDDIWHSHTSSNIFQIVSHRIGKVNP
jgi:hypothetical protein